MGKKNKKQQPKNNNNDNNNVISEDDAVIGAEVKVEKTKKSRKETQQEVHPGVEGEGEKEEVATQNQDATKENGLELSFVSGEEKESFENFKSRYREVVPNEELSDKLLLRIVRSRKYDVNRSLVLVQNYVTWYNNIGIKELRIDHVRRVMQEYIMAQPGARDKDGYQIVFMRPNSYFPDKIHREELIRAVVYTMERVVEDTKTEIEGFTFMCDMKNWGWQNFETKYAQNFFHTMENRFPARLRKFILVDPPGWFNIVWRLIRPMMGTKFASKWHFLPQERLSEIIDDDNILKDFGGRHPHDQMEWIKKRYEMEGVEWTEEAIVPELKGSMLVSSS